MGFRVVLVLVKFDKCRPLFWGSGGLAGHIIMKDSDVKFDKSSPLLVGGGGHIIMIDSDGVVVLYAAL